MATTTLKVVGASWYQTRISTYILMGSGLLVIAAFFIADMDRPKFDGTYCATVYWTKSAGFKIEYWKQRTDLENIPKGVARTCYKDTTHENGWSQIEIETHRTYPDWVQAFGAGLLEGSLTWNSIHNQWLNTISSACNRNDDTQNFCTWMRDLLSTNYEDLKEMLRAKHSPHDHYWHQIQLFYYQLEGLEAGWRKGAKRARSDLEDIIPSEDFLLMNAASDIQDLKIYFENFIMHQNNSETEQKNFMIPSATMVMKLLQKNYTEILNNNSSQNKKKNGWLLLFGHSSAGSYSSMLRIQKRYKFHYHFTIDQRTNTVPGYDISFTGYPGILSSTDDFYIVRGRQVTSLVAGVALKNDNIQLWNDININQIIPLSARVMAANRLAQNRRTWAKAMSRHPSTGCKQWILIDLRKINYLNSPVTQTIEDNTVIDDVKSAKGMFWIVEQLPGRLHAEEVTEEVLNNIDNYWYANGTPYFNEIIDASQILIEDVVMQRYSDINVTSLDDIEYILRKSAFRGDLLGEQSIPYGNIDIKLFSHDTNNERNYFHAIAGPLFMYKYYKRNVDTLKYYSNISNLNSTNIGANNSTINETDDNEISDRRSVRNDLRAIAMRQLHGPFKWSKVDNNLSDVMHVGHPDEWNFDKTSPKWAWHD